MSLGQRPEFLPCCVASGAGVPGRRFGAWTVVADRIHRRHARGFRLDRATHGAVTFRSLGLCGIGIRLFFTIPWIATPAIRP